MNTSNLDTIRVVTELSEAQTRKGIFQFAESGVKKKEKEEREEGDLILAMIGAVKFMNSHTTDEAMKPVSSVQGTLQSMSLRSEQFNAFELASCETYDFPREAVDPETGVVEIQVFIRFKYIYACILQHLA